MLLLLHMIFLFILTFKVILSRSKVVERIDYESHVRVLILKSQFLKIDDKEMKNVNKGSWKVSKHADFGQKAFLMNGNFFMVLTQQNPLLIFFK